MALISAILGMSAEAGNSASQTTGGATSAISVGAYRQLAINADQDVRIRFGNSSVAAVVTDFRIPQNQTFVFNTGPDTAYFSLYNNSGSTANYSWAYLSKF